MSDPSKTFPSPGPLWDSRCDYSRVALRSVEVDMHIGIAGHEQGVRQKVIVTVELFSRQRAQNWSDISDCINYDPIHDYITSNWPHRPHTDLLETLAEELIAMCFRDARVEAARVLLQKPDIYGDTGAAEVEFYRIRTTA